MISGGSLDIDDVVVDGTTIGHTDDTDLMTLTSGTLTVAGTVAATTLTGDGSGITGLATSVNGLSDALVETNSMYIGDDPSSTTDAAQYNLAVGINALDAVTTGDTNVAIGYDALTSNTTGESNNASGYRSLTSHATVGSTPASGTLHSEPTN